MGTPEENGSKNFSVRRSLANGLSIALMGISSALGMVSCSSVEKNDSQEGNNIAIPLSDYPSSEENFILNDPRTNREKIETVKSVAPDDYQKEVNLLSEEWKRMGKNESDLEMVASIVDGKSWVLVARSKGSGRVFVPKIDGIVQASLHLFGRLDEAGDFFDLVPVDIEGATVVGDGSGWHVVARVEDGGVLQWYDATRDEVRTVEVGEPSPTPDVGFQNLLPETLAEVRQENVIRENHLEEDLATLMEKEKQLNTEIESFNSGISGRDIQKNKLPGIIPLTVTSKNSIVSCSYLEKNDGEQIYVLGVALKRPGSENVGIIHFAIDLNTLEDYNSLLKLETEYFNSTYNLTNTYQKLKKGEFNYFIIETVSWRGYAEEGGIWDQLLSLNPGIADRDGRNKWLLNMYIGGQSLDKETNKWVTVADYGEERLISELERMILPAVSIGIIY